MLLYAVELHRRSTHPAAPPFTNEWEEIGPGYGYGPAFGHWDVVHEILDLLPTEPERALTQLLNDIRLQDDAGFIPGAIWMPGSPGSRGHGGRAAWDRGAQGHPPVWVVAADAYLALHPSRELMQEFYDRAVKQIGWFDAHRKATPEGYFYNDILLGKWESGVDEGIRFDDAARGNFACVDTTAHVFQLCHYAAQWAAALGLPSTPWAGRAAALQTFIQTQLYDADTHFFYDSWAVSNPKMRHLAFEGLWPLYVGAASPAQAGRIIDQYVLNPQAFFTPHPIASVGAGDPKFELRMWRGPAWNSMTYWTAQACVRYGRPDAARKLLEAALDNTAVQFAKTGKIWEFYHPYGGNPADLARKPHTKQNQPWPDYLGHNPLLAMARLYDAVSK